MTHYNFPPCGKELVSGQIGKSFLDKMKFSRTKLCRSAPLSLGALVNFVVDVPLNSWIQTIVSISIEWPYLRCESPQAEYQYVC